MREHVTTRVRAGEEQINPATVRRIEDDRTIRPASAVIGCSLVICGRASKHGQSTSIWSRDHYGGQRQISCRVLESGRYMHVIELFPSAATSIDI